MAGWLGTVTPYTKGIVHKSNGSMYIRIRRQNLSIKERIDDFFRRYGSYVYIGMCIRFAEVAAKYTPPNMGRANIDQKYYSRPIYRLDDLAKGLIKTPKGRVIHATKEDYAALRAGFKFKVINTKYKAPKELKIKAVAYTKGINEAKRIARIENRGLSKYSWGANLNNTKEDLNNRIQADPTAKTHQIWEASKMPPIFQRLARKSPNITKYTWGSYMPQFITSGKDVKKIRVTITNRLAEIQSYGNIAIRRGIDAVRKYVNNLWKGVDALAMDQSSTLDNYHQDYQIAIKDLRASMTKMFDETTNRYGVNVINFKQSVSVPEGQFQIRR